MLCLLPATRTAANPDDGGYLAKLKEGLRYVRGDKLLRAMIGMLMLTNGIDYGLSGVLYPAYGTQVLHSSTLIGVMITAVGAGALFGTIVYGWIGHRFSRWATYLAAFAVVGAPRFAVLALEPSPVWLVLALALCGIGSGMLNPILLPVIYQRVPEHLRGRVLSLVVAGALAAMPVGTLVAGMLLDGVGLTGVLLVFGAVYLVVTSFPLVFGVWRELDGQPARASG